MKRLGVLFVAITLGVSLPGAADPVDDYVNATLAREKIPGASVLIVQTTGSLNSKDMVLRTSNYAFLRRLTRFTSPARPVSSSPRRASCCWLKTESCRWTIAFPSILWMRQPHGTALRFVIS
jgi:hypothetical protein